MSAYLGQTNEGRMDEQTNEQLNDCLDACVCLYACVLVCERVRIAGSCPIANCMCISSRVSSLVSLAFVFAVRCDAPDFRLSLSCNFS